MSSGFIAPPIQATRDLFCRSLLEFREIIVPIYNDSALDISLICHPGNPALSYLTVPPGNLSIASQRWPLLFRSPGRLLRAGGVLFYAGAKSLGVIQPNNSLKMESSY